MATTDDLTRNIEHLRSEGYCILENVIPSDEVDALRNSVLATADSEKYQETRDFIGNNRDFPRYVGSERVQGIVDAMLGRFARIAFTGPIIRQEKDKRGNWHSDWPFGAGGAAFIPEPYPDVVAYLTSIWMLTPFSAATGGTLIIVLGVLIFLHNFFWSLRKGETAGGDPWDGRTLEWSMSSPPPEYNFATIPTVHGRDAFWEQKYANGHAVPQGASDHEEHHEDEGHGIHMPSPSYWPLVAAVGLAVAGYGMVFHEPGQAPGAIVAIIGVAITMVGTYAWAMEPPSEPSEH